MKEKYPYALPDRLVIAANGYLPILDWERANPDKITEWGIRKIIRINLNGHPGAVAGMRSKRAVLIQPKGGLTDHQLHIWNLAKKGASDGVHVANLHADEDYYREGDK